MTSTTSTSPDRTTVLAFAGMVLFGGLNTIAVKQTVLELDALWGAALRFLAAGAIFTILTFVRRRPFPTGRSLTGAILYGAVGFAAAFGLIYPGLRSGVPAGTAAVVIALSPLATYGLAVVQGQERFRFQGLVGAFVALLGIAFIFAEQMGTDVPIGALAMVVLGMVFLSESGIIAKSTPRSDPYATNAVAMLTAGAILLAGSFLLGEGHNLPERTSTWLGLGYITVFGSVVMFSLYLEGIRRWTASGMSYATLMLPIVSVTAATLLTGEAFSLAFLAGTAVMLAGVYIGAFGHERPGRSTATSLPECLPIADCPDPLTAAPKPSPATT